MLQNPNQTRKPVSATVPIPRNPQPSNIYLEGLKSAGQVSQVNRGPEKPANVHSSQPANYNISFGTNPNPTQIQTSVSGSSQVEGGGSVGGQVGQPYGMQMYPGAAPPRSNHPLPQRFVNPNAGSGSGGNRGQRQPTQNYPPQQQQPGFMVPNHFIQPAQIYIPQPAAYIHNTHRMPNSNQQPQQFVQQQIQYPQNYVNSNSQSQQLSYMNQPYQSNSYTQPNQQHQSVVTHVTSTQPPNNPYQQSAQHQMLVQNPPQQQQPQQREKKIIRIIDPSTGKTLNDEIRTNRMSSPSVTSTNQAEEVKDQSTEVADDTKSKVCQEFAAKVAARCKSDQSQASPAEDSKNEELPKEETVAVEKPEEPKEEEKPEEIVEAKEEVTVEPEEKPEEEEAKPEEEEEEAAAAAAIVEEKPEKAIVEEKSSETDEKGSKKKKVPTATLR